MTIRRKVEGEINETKEIRLDDGVNLFSNRNI